MEYPSLLFHKKQDLWMASIPPSTWASVPTSLSSHTVAAGATASGAKFISFPPIRFKSRKALSASSSEDVSSAGETESPDPVQLALSKAKAYRKANSSPPPPASTTSQKPSPEPEVPAAVKIAMEKAKEYKKNKGVSVEETKDPGQEDLKLRNSGRVSVDGKLNKKDELKISSKDFLGLDFSEKKNYRGKPPGLAPYVAPLGDGDASEVEIIVGDASKFERTPSPASNSGEVDDNTCLYKPKVSTWGVFPRPNNISKTFGGGRVIQPGERLETTETKEAKEKHTRELIAAYKRRMGLTIDPKTRVQCEKALKEGDNLMDRGQLKQALPYYEEVMKSLVFKSELHGLAALQWSICQDSLSRPNEARVMYEKLQSHPNAEVSKKARQFVFSFQAMEMMKVKGSYFSSKTGYEDYFEAFVEKKAGFTPSDEEQNESVLDQAFPYLIFVLSPIFIILFVAFKKSF